jgi:hypothetical protein
MPEPSPPPTDFGAVARAAAARRPSQEPAPWRKPRSRFAWGLIAGLGALCGGVVVAVIEVWVFGYFDPRSLRTPMMGVAGGVLWLADEAGLMKDPYTTPASVLHLRNSKDVGDCVDAEPRDEK